MKKILLPIISCLLLTGCTINYNLEIENNSFTETIKGNVLNEELTIDQNQTDINLFNYLLTTKQQSLLDNEDLIYETTISKNDNSNDYNYTFTYNENNINNSKVLNSCFENFKFEEKDNIYYFTAFGDFYCDYANEIKINVTTDYKVSSHNAEKTNKNTYTWTINKNNTNDLKLYITINKNQNSNTNSSWSTLKIVGLIILLVLSGICLFILKKKKEQY